MTIWSDIKRPINIITLSIGFLSIVVSLILYSASLKTREPVFYADDTKGKIFDSSLTSPAIKVLDKKDQLIAEDIFLVTATFWNAGELPIEPEHVRKPIHMTLTPVKRILDYKILDQVEPDIAQIKLDDVTISEGQVSSNEVQVTWAHLDPGYGARFQMIYIGEEDAEISFTGKISGVDKIKNTKPLGKKYKFIDSLFSLFLGMISYLVVRLSVSGYKDIKRNESTFVIKITLVIFIILVSFFTYYFVIKGPTPPI